MPRSWPTYLFQSTQSLAQTMAVQRMTQRKPVPAVWLVTTGEYQTPYVGPDLSKRTKTTPLETPVMLNDGSALGVPALHLHTGAGAHVLHGGYLVSDGFQSCVAAVAVSATRTYLAHIDSPNYEVLFDGWEQDITVMLVRKKYNQVNCTKAMGARDHCAKRFTGGAYFVDIPWLETTAVIVHGSSCIVYRENSKGIAPPNAAADIKHGGYTKHDTKHDGAATASTSAAATAAAGTTAAATANTFTVTSTATALPPNTKSGPLG